MNYESEPITKINFSAPEGSEADKGALGSEIMEMAKWTKAELSDEELRVCLTKREFNDKCLCDVPL